MARVRLKLGKLSVTDKIARCRHIVANMTNNAPFANPHPSLTEVTAAVDELEAAFAQVQASKSETTTRVGRQENAEKKLDQLMTRLGNFVESVAGSDESLIASTGMEIKVSRTTPTIPTAPQSVAATTGEHEGEIILSWKAVSNESNLDPANGTGWTQVGLATAANKVISNLTSGKRYWFRVKTAGAAGESGWSEHASKVAP
jgi:hypothetical protein